MRIGIGIDTGGTSTDAVLIDLDTRSILDTSKALTTHYDLMTGILQALDGLDPDLCRKAELAGLSTTLATNACVEGKARKSRLLLLGIDHEGIARNGARFGLRDPDDIRYLPCRTTIRGEVLEEPDWDVLRRHAKAWFYDVEAVAVCEIFAVRNQGVLEKKAAQIIQEQTGLPVVESSTLFGDLSSLERAASALLNAGLIPITRDFLNAAQQAFRARGITAELMVVRSDSSLMSRSFAMEHAVETLLSGPAASALGGSTLVGADQAIIVDMGGTTTDIALIDNRLPILCEDGIRVGDWKTLVRGLFSTSFALGGDSVIRWRFDQLTIGPERVIPLCRLAVRHPEIVRTLRDQIRATPTHSLPLHEFLTLGRSDWESIPMRPEEERLCRALSRGPLSIQQAANLLHLDKYLLDTSALEQSGAIVRAGLTPTDIMHVRGDFTAYDTDCARLAAEFAAASLDMQPEALCRRVYTEIERRIFLGASQMLLEHTHPYFRKNGLDAGIQAVLELQWKNRKQAPSGLLRLGCYTPATLIGIGGPIHLFLKQAADALHAPCVIPDHAPTANAVGAVTGQITATVSGEVRVHARSAEESDFQVVIPGVAIRSFEEAADAVAYCRECICAQAEQRVRAQGAVGEVRVTVHVTDNEYNGTKLATRIAATASTYVHPETKEDDAVSRRF